MGYQSVVDALGESFVTRPFDFVTEVDLQVELARRLDDDLAERDARMASVSDPRLVGGTRSYKEVYKETIEERLQEQQAMGRVHTEVSVKQGKRYDIAVFNETVQHPLEWVSAGSKRFDERDLDAVVELKYVKNKCYPPTHCSIRDDRLLELSLPDLVEELDTKENKLEGDLEELRALPDTVETYFVLVSNNNYLFAEPLSTAEQAEEKKKRVGEAARHWLRETVDKTGVLYVHPRGKTWLSE